MEINPYAIPGIIINDEKIIESVCRVYDLSTKNLLATSRKRRIVEPRHLAIFLIIVIGRKGVTYIEENYNYDHSTAIYCINTVKALYQTSFQYRKNMSAILDDLHITGENRQQIISFLHMNITWTAFKKKI